MFLHNEVQAAKRLALSVRTLQQWRVKGIGPKFVKIGTRFVRYPESEIAQWVNENLKQSTSEE